MTKPGEQARQDAKYKRMSSTRRRFYERGSTNGQPVLKVDKAACQDMADKASRYKGLKGGKPQYSNGLPMKAGKPDHAKIIDNVKKWVDATLHPDDDPANRRILTMKGFSKLFGAGKIGPGKSYDPNGTGKGAWVCIDHAVLMAGLMRKLGYATREINIPLSTNGLYDYQEAAIQVWYNGKWNFVDPYLCNYNPKDTLGDYSTFTDYMVHAAKRAVKASDFIKYHPRTGKPLSGSPWQSIQTKPVRRSGVYFRSTNPAVHFYISDFAERGMITGRVNMETTKTELANSFATDARAPIFGWHANVDPIGFRDEAVFLGFDNLDPKSKDRGSRELRLTIWAESPTDAEIILTPWSTSEPISLLIEGEPGLRITQNVNDCALFDVNVTILVGQALTKKVSPAAESLLSLDLSPNLIDTLRSSGIRDLIDVANLDPEDKILKQLLGTRGSISIRKKAERLMNS